VLSTSRDNQPELELTIFQGDSDRADANEYLGTLKLPNLPKGPKGSVKVDVAFEVSSEGVLKVVAKESSTGQEVAATLVTHDTPEEVRAKMLKEAASAPQPLQTAPPTPAEALPAEVAAEANKGLLGWFKRLFARA
jgi:molecular chaperone DnaK